jgi:GT2 family glycosyltransferase
MISLIIPAYNNVFDVLRCVNSLMGMAGADVNLLIQDDCSPDVDFTQIYPPQICERNAVNLGFAGNVNAGAKRAQGDILFFVNQDVFAIPNGSFGWAQALERAFEDATVGIVGARLLFPGSHAIQSAGGLFDGRCAPYHRCLGYSNPYYDEVNTRMDVSWVTGAALAIRRDLFWQVGGFDLDYAPSYFEDVALCCKVREAGYRVRYEPSLTFEHRVGSTGGSAHFQNSALTFKQRWVDSGKIKPDEQAVRVRYW